MLSLHIPIRVFTKINHALDYKDHLNKLQKLEIVQQAFSHNTGELEINKNKNNEIQKIRPFFLG